MKHQKTGFKSSVFTTNEHNMLEAKLNNPQNKLQGYVELKDWIEKEPDGANFSPFTRLLCVFNLKLLNYSQEITENFNFFYLIKPGSPKKYGD